MQRIKGLKVLSRTAFFLLAALPISYAATLVSAPVAAQQAVLEEVIVTAQKREESLQEAPLAVTAFTERDLEDLGAIEFGTVANKAPNITLRKQTASHSNYAFGIRGVSAGETALAVDSVVGLYVDGVYLGRLTGSAFDISDTERVEVLRGPQGTLYGRNAVAGAINIITNKPKEDFEFRNYLTSGERGLLRYQSTINTGNLPVAGGMLSARFNFSNWEHDGIVENTADGEKNGDIDSDAARLSLRWDSGDGLTVDYNYDTSEKVGNSQTQQITGFNSQLYSMFPASILPVYKKAAATASNDRAGSISVPGSREETSEIDAHALTVEWEMPSGVVFKSITSYREWDSELPDFGNDFGSFTYDGPVMQGMGPAAVCVANCVHFLDKEDGQVKLAEAGELITLFSAQRRSSQEQFTQEFQFSGELELLDFSVDWVGGVYYFQEKADEDNPQKNAVPGHVLAFVAGLTTHMDRFGQGSYHGKGSGSMCGDPNAVGAGFTDLSSTFGLPANTLTIANACFGKVVLGGGGGVFKYGTENEAYALYWQGRYAVDDRTNLTVGLRYTKDDKEGYLESVPVFSAKITSSVVRVSDDDSWSKFTWDVSVDHQWTDEINVYGRIASGYRAGGYNVRINIIENFAEPVDEENILSYELGAKTQWFDDRLRANLTLFYAEYEDKQTSIFSPSLAGATSIISNFGEQTNQGVELEVVAIPVPGLTLGLNYGYTDVEIKKGAPGDDPDTLVPPYAPETTAYAWMQYEFAPSDYGTLALRIDYDYADKFTISGAVPLNDPANRATERNLWGARISLNDIPLGDADLGRLSIAFWGRNLKNEEYREFVIPFGYFNSGTYGELRSLGMDIVYDY